MSLQTHKRLFCAATGIVCAFFISILLALFSARFETFILFFVIGAIAGCITGLFVLYPLLKVRLELKDKIADAIINGFACTISGTVLTLTLLGLFSLAYEAMTCSYGWDNCFQASKFFDGLWTIAQTTFLLSPILFPISALSVFLAQIIWARIKGKTA